MGVAIFKVTDLVHARTRFHQLAHRLSSDTGVRPRHQSCLGGSGGHGGAPPPRQQASGSDTPRLNNEAPNRSTNSQPTSMLFPALVLPLLTARAASGPAHPPDDLPPWGAALLAKVGKLEGTISSLQTTIKDHSARIRELEASPRQHGDGTAATISRVSHKPVTLVAHSTK